MPRLSSFAQDLQHVEVTRTLSSVLQLFDSNCDRDCCDIMLVVFYATEGQLNIVLANKPSSSVASMSKIYRVTCDLESPFQVTFFTHCTIIVTIWQTDMRLLIV